MATIIKDTDFTSIGKNVKPDSRKRVILPKSLVKEGISFQIWVNSEGQILLEPQVTIPASEAWVFQNSEILSLVKRGLSEAAEGKFSEIDLDDL